MYHRPAVIISRVSGDAFVRRAPSALPLSSTRFSVLARIHPYSAMNSIRVSLAALLLSISRALAAIPVVPAQWSSDTTGTLDGVPFTISNMAAPWPGRVEVPWYVSAAGNYAAAPLPDDAEMIQYAMDSDWTLTLEQPVDALLLYVGGWRGNQTTEADPATAYFFDRPFSVLSGLADVTRDGSALSFPETGGWFGLHSGVLLFEGPLTTLSVEATTPSGAGHGQLLTFGTVVPEPDKVAAIAALGLAAFAAVRRRLMRTGA